MRIEQIKQTLKEFENGEREISIDERYKDVFETYLKLNNIKRYWIRKHRHYLNYRTSTLKRSEYRNSDIRHLKKLNKQELIAKLEYEKHQLELEIFKLKE